MHMEYGCSLMVDVKGFFLLLTFDEGDIMYIWES